MEFQNILAIVSSIFGIIAGVVTIMGVMASRRQHSSPNFPPVYPPQSIYPPVYPPQSTYPQPVFPQSPHKPLTRDPGFLGSRFFISALLLLGILGWIFGADSIFQAQTWANFWVGGWANWSASIFFARLMVLSWPVAGMSAIVRAVARLNSGWAITFVVLIIPVYICIFVTSIAFSALLIGVAVILAVVIGILAGIYVYFASSSDA